MRGNLHCMYRQSPANSKSQSALLKQRGGIVKGIAKTAPVEGEVPPLLGEHGKIEGRVYQVKEAPQFVAIFQPMVILKGGLSSGYKNHILEKGLHDDTYNPETTALIEISGTSPHNTKAQQVEKVASSLNSYGCFILQYSTAAFTWYGNQSTAEQ